MKKAAVIAISIVAGLLILTAGADLWIGHRIKRIVEQKTAELSGGALHAEISRASFRLIGRSVTLKGIHISSDSAALAAVDPSIRSLSVYIKRLKIEGIGFDEQVGERMISVGSISLDSPSVTLERNPSDTTRRIKGKAEKSLGGKVTGTIGAVAIGLFEIRNGRIEYCEHRDGRRLCHVLNGIGMQTSDFRFDISPDSAGRSLLENDIRLSVNQAGYMFDKGAMMLEADTVTVGTRAGIVSIAGLRLLPQYAKTDFARLAPRHADWTQVVVGELACMGVDFKGILAKKRLVIDSVRISDVAVGSYKNRQIAQPPHVKALFYESLQRFPLKTSIRRISLSGMTADYEELATGGVRPGHIRFTDLAGEFYGLTNDTSGGKESYRLVASGKLMGRGELHAEFTFPVDSADNRFTVQGRLGAFDLTEINPVVTPLADAKIDAGRINGMNFTITGGNMRSDVRMEMLYNDLSVTLLHEDRRQTRERRLLSFIADQILIQHDNPGKKGLRIGEGTTQRNLQRSQFNYLWKSLLPGIKQTVIGSNLKERQSAWPRRDKDRKNADR